MGGSENEGTADIGADEDVIAWTPHSPKVHARLRERPALAGNGCAGPCFWAMLGMHGIGRDAPTRARVAGQTEASPWAPVDLAAHPMPERGSRDPPAGRAPGSGE